MKKEKIKIKDLYDESKFLDLVVIYKHLKNISKEIDGIREEELIELFKIFVDLKKEQK